MKTSRTALLLGIALTAFTSIAQAQIITTTFDITGVPNGAVTRFTIKIDAGANTLTVDINNALPLTNGQNTQVGTLTGFGFNTPWGIASQNNDAPGSVAVTAKWTQVNSGHSGVPTAFSGNINAADDFWSEETPYSLNPSFSNDYGVKAGTPNTGIEYGEKATFVFTFTQDINAGNLAGFFDNGPNTTNIYDFSARWQEVGKKSLYGAHGDGCGDLSSDKGGWNGRLPPSDSELPPTPEPSTYGLMGAAALLGLAAHRRHKAKKAAKTV